MRKVLLLLGILGAVQFAHAESNVTIIVDGIYTNAGSPFYVGESGSFNSLLVTNEGWLENGTGILGHSAPGNSGIRT